MAGLSLEQPLPFIFGISGNIISFMVFLSPLPTFYRIYRKKSTEGFQSVPYVVALSSCMLLIYYALVKTNAILLITINSFGCFIETAYITIYLIYATKKARVFCIQIFVLLNVVAFAAIVLLTRLAFTGPDRVTLPNVLGFVFGVVQMVVYMLYKNNKKKDAAVAAAQSQDRGAELRPSFRVAGQPRGEGSKQEIDGGQPRDR
ncbi:hypothetical protein C4D60_Mb02t02290 [Musa balbisiana]|uniref:Bidirectional sugar transporter SWEET n=1 Tax=Musa balbisiana TaxID=52838 RepID=A0A4S8I7N4_MUSBA|nr:hypothetical protein C4D60_Mb02t02290 [Musa balbisiana]